MTHPTPEERAEAFCDWVTEEEQEHRDVFSPELHQYLVDAFHAAEAPLRERIAELERAVAEEREACAKIVENPNSSMMLREDVAAAIRRRGERDES